MNRRVTGLGRFAIMAAIAALAAAPAAGKQGSDRAQYEMAHPKRKHKPRDPELAGRVRPSFGPRHNPKRQARRKLEAEYLAATGRPLSGRQFVRMRKSDARAQRWGGMAVAA